jgi:hypothetical protein
VLLSLVTAAMAGLGRSGGHAAADVPLTYGVFMAPAYVGFFMLGLPLAERRLRAATVPMLLTAMSVVLLVQQVIMGAALIGVSDRNRILIQQFNMVGRSAQIAAVVYPDLPRAASIASGNHRRGWYLGEVHLPATIRPNAGR